MNSRTPDRAAPELVRADADVELVPISSRREEIPARRTRLDAVASLLADDSPAVVQEVRRALDEAGAQALPALARAAKCSDARLRSRARALLVEHEKQSSLRRVLRYASRPDPDLERALLLLARYHAPGLDPRPYSRALDAMAAELARRVPARKPATPDAELQRALALSQYLGQELGIGGSRGEFHHPDNIHLHRAIERRAGVPLTLSAIWVFVARRAGIRAGFVPLPGHVMVRIYAGWQSAIVDPYHHGKRRTEAECRSYLQKHGITVGEASFREAPDAALLRRQVGNLARSAELRSLPAEARGLTGLLHALEPRRADRGARRSEPDASGPDRKLPG
jgi:regulator of sirC expression with transglutaminase-like and TPR domain